MPCGCSADQDRERPGELSYPTVLMGRGHGTALSCSRNQTEQRVSLAGNGQNICAIPCCLTGQMEVQHRQWASPSSTSNLLLGVKVILVQKGVSAAPPQESRAKCRLCAYVMASWEFFKQNTALVQSIYDEKQNILLRTRFQLNFHVQNVIYEPNQEKELLQSRAENLYEL